MSMKTDRAAEGQEAGKMQLMTEGSIFKSILLFALPLLLGNLLQQMYNTVDSIIVGNYVSMEALAAVGSSTSLINLLISFSQGTAAGAGVIISQYLGAEQKENTSRAVHTALTVAALLGVALAAAGALCSRPLLLWMKTPESVMPDAAAYLRVYSGGIVFTVLYNMAAGILNAAGNSRRSLLYLACAATINVGLDLLLIVKLGMGVSGAALATDISQGLSCVLALAFLLRVKAPYRVSLRELGIRKRMLEQILKVGLPTGIQNMVISLSNMLVQSSVNGFGEAAMAGFGAYMKVDGFNILPVISFSMAITTFVGQNYGAGKLDRVKKGVRMTILMEVVYTLVTAVVLLLLSGQVMRLFTPEAEAIAYGQLAMRYFCPFYWLIGIMHGLAGAVRGTGKTIPPMAVLLTALCLFRMLWLQFVQPHIGTIHGVLLQYPISWALGAVLMALYVWKGRWLTEWPVK